MEQIIAFITGLGVTPLEIVSLIAIYVLWKRLREVEDKCLQFTAQHTPDE